MNAVAPFSPLDDAPEPSSLEIEQAVLAALLQDNRRFDELATLLTPEDFYDDTHRRLYVLAGELITRGQAATGMVLKDHFVNDRSLAGLGGVGYILKLQSAGVGFVDLHHWAGHLRDLSVRRQAIRIGADLVTDAARVDLDRTGLQVLETAEQRLGEVAEGKRAARQLETFADAMRETINAVEENFKFGGKLLGLPTGYPTFDEFTGGMAPGCLIALAGRPGMGKTSLALGIAENVAKSGKRVLFFSMEMSRRSLMERLLVARTGIRHSLLARGRLTSAQMERVIEAGRSMTDLPLVIDDTEEQTPQSALAIARREKRTGGLDLVIFDHLGYMRASRRTENRNLEVGAITKGLRALAKHLDLPVIVLSQLSRKVEDREDKRPHKGDLRDSGEIEQDADAIWFPYRQHYYLRREEPKPRANEDELKFSGRMAKWIDDCEACRHSAEIIVDKQRNGPTGAVKLRFDEATMHFSDPADADPPDDREPDLWQ